MARTTIFISYSHNTMYDALAWRTLCFRTLWTARSESQRQCISSPGIRRGDRVGN